MANNTPACVKAFWPAFGDNSKLVEIECEEKGGLAADVLSTFGISLVGGSTTGGVLQDLDIKHMDAMSVINLSLLETLANSGSASGFMYEPIVTVDGNVKFTRIGGSPASLTDIYYQLQTGNHVKPCQGVIVRGGQIMPSWEDLEWKLIWGNDDSKEIIDTTQMVTNCMLPNFSTHAIILFNDPNLENSSYNDGINNLYDITSPWKKILGYVKFIDVPGATADTRVNYSNSSIIPIKIGGDDDNGPNMGTLQPRPSHDPEAENYGECWTFIDRGTAESAANGVKIPLPDSLRFESISGQIVDKFVRVEEILIIGRELSMVHAGALNDSVAANQDAIDSNTIALVSENSMNSSVTRLEEGKHYAIVYEEDGDFKIPYVVFAKDARVNEPKNYGANTKYKISQFGESGYYRAGEDGIGTIFPVAENKGYLVEELWAMVAVDTPSISVYDPEYDSSASTSKAIDLAKNLKYWVAPLVIEEPPPSIAFNGDTINQKPTVADNDPTTVQDFIKTEMEWVMDQMDGGPGLDITLSFFNKPGDESKLESLSSSLYNFMNAENGVEATYVCGPDTDVELGQIGPAGGIINSITYSYTDSSSYTISVNEGARMVKGFTGGGPSGPSFKTTEPFNATGTVIDSIGNGMFFKVRIDGYGERVAVNLSKELLRVGDIVSCAVHNNPVET